MSRLLKLIIGIFYYFIFKFDNKRSVRTIKITGTKFEGKNLIDKGVTIYNSFVGFGSYISTNSDFSNTKIGKFCSISFNVKVILGTHPTKKFVSTSPYFYSKVQSKSLLGKIYAQEEYYNSQKYLYKNYCVKICNDVWIGAGVKILSGVKINNGAIIGAGSLVTKDVPAYAIVAGNPAKIIRYRFNDKQIELLNKVEWWNFPEKELELNCSYFQDIEKFIERCTNFSN